jgi:predicted RNA-binding protein with TRAM domain
VCVHTYLTTIKEKRGLEFEREKVGHGGTGRRKGEGGYVIIIEQNNNNNDF